MEIINGAFSSGAVEHHCILSDFVIPTIYGLATGKHHFVLMGGSTVQKVTKFVPEKQTKFCFWPDEHSFRWEECQGNKLRCVSGFFLRVFGIPQMVLREMQRKLTSSVTELYF